MKSDNSEWQLHVEIKNYPCQVRLEPNYDVAVQEAYNIVTMGMWLEWSADKATLIPPHRISEIILARMPDGPA